jgi:hypothetical protein
MDQIKSEFEFFLSFFPKVELPANLSSEYFSMFGTMNKPIPELLAKKYLELESTENNDVYTEIVPCFSLPETENFKGVVYLKISLLNYDFLLHTYDNAGRPIAYRIISNMTSNGTDIHEKAALIDDMLRIWIMEADTDESNNFDPAISKFISFHVNDKGEIVEK